MDARRLRGSRGIAAPQRVEELGGGHLSRYAKPSRSWEAPADFTLQSGGRTVHMRSVMCGGDPPLRRSEAIALTVQRFVLAATSLELVRQVRLEPELGVRSIVHHDRNGALDLVIDLCVKHLARRGIVDDLRRCAAADRLIDELCAVRAKLV